MLGIVIVIVVTVVLVALAASIFAREWVNFDGPLDVPWKDETDLSALAHTPGPPQLTILEPTDAEEPTDQAIEASDPPPIPRTLPPEPKGAKRSLESRLADPEYREAYERAGAALAAPLAAEEPAEEEAIADEVVVVEVEVPVHPKRSTSSPRPPRTPPTPRGKSPNLPATPPAAPSWKKWNADTRWNR